MMNRPQKKTNSVPADQHDSDSRGIGVPPMKDPRSWPGRPCHFKQQHRNDSLDLMKKMRNEDAQLPRPSSFVLHPSSFFSGFTFVELVVALGIGAMVVAVAIMAYGAINSQGTSKRQLNVNIGINNAFSFYGWTDPRTAVSESPSFGATAMANSLREQFLSDVSSASAVVCLARNMPNINALRPTNLALPTNLDARTLVSPDNFRTNLIDPSRAVYTNFSSNALGNGATFATNLSVYILSPGSSSTNISVDAIYETDWVAVTNAPVGVYASVRRYVGANMTGYYHVFYPQVDSRATNSDTGLQFTPIQRPNPLPCAAYFSRSNASTTNIFSKAENRPFYFIWWPDPMNRTVLPQAPFSGQGNKILNPTNASDYYTLQFGASSYFFVVPAYPAL